MSLFAYRGLNCPQRETVNDVLFRQPPFARNADTEPQFLESLSPMGIGVDHALHSFFFRERPPAPIEIEALQRGVDLNPCASLGCCIDDRGNIDRVRITL